jgi:hypothetical protein
MARALTYRPADVYFGRAETILAERQRIKRATKPALAASAAGRLNSNPDEPEPLFAKRLTSLKLSAEGHMPHGLILDHLVQFDKMRTAPPSMPGRPPKSDCLIG